MDSVQVGVSNPIGSDQITPANEQANAGGGFVASLEGAIDQGVTAVSNVISVVQPVVDIAAAAILANQAPAASDPVAGSVATLEQRIVSIENVLKPIEGIAEVAAPGSVGLIDRVAAIEGSLEKLMEFAKHGAPLLDRVLSAFNIHFGGKI